MDLAWTVYLKNITAPIMEQQFGPLPTVEKKEISKQDAGPKGTDTSLTYITCS